MTPADIRKAGEALARRTRKAQSLPKTIRDPEAIRAVVTLLVRAYQGKRAEDGAI
jgi:hypothetical protein